MDKTSLPLLPIAAGEHILVDRVLESWNHGSFFWDPLTENPPLLTPTEGSSWPMLIMMGRNPKDS